MGGKERILDIGGVPYLIPLAQKHKLYNMTDYPSLTEMNLKEGEQALIVGAGAAPFTYIQRNAEVRISIDSKNSPSVFRIKNELYPNDYIFFKIIDEILFH